MYADYRWIWKYTTVKNNEKSKFKTYLQKNGLLVLELLEQRLSQDSTVLEYNLL